MHSPLLIKLIICSWFMFFFDVSSQLQTCVSTQARAVWAAARVQSIGQLGISSQCH